MSLQAELIKSEKLWFVRILVFSVLSSFPPLDHRIVHWAAVRQIEMIVEIADEAPLLDLEDGGGREDADGGDEERAHDAVLLGWAAHSD